MSSDDSDIDIRSALSKKQNKNMPSSPTEELLEELYTSTELPSKKKTKKVRASPSKELPKNITVRKAEHKEEESRNVKQKEDNNMKKMTTKLMVTQALKDLKSRKGVSLYAIKKYLKENFEVNTEKVNYIIKKAIKQSIEDGTVVQTKGTGASGSFKLAPGKPEKSPKPKKLKITKEDKEKLKIMLESEKITELKENLEKPKKDKSKEGKIEEKQVKVKKIDKEKKVAGNKSVAGEKKEKKTKTKSTKHSPTAAEKRAAMIKRKSIGTIIKPPKMKPKAKA